MSQTDFTDDDRFDGLYLNVANTARGIEPMLDTVFSFLRRKTDFLNGPSGQDSDAAVAKVNEVLQKHIKIHQEKKSKEAEDARRRAAVKKNKVEAIRSSAEEKTDVEGVIELGDGGFDISTAAAEESATPSIVTEEQPKEAPKSDTKVSKSVDEPTEKTGDDDDDDDAKGPPPPGNGGTVEGKYVWTQTLSEVNVVVPLPDGTRGRDLHVVIGKKRLKVGLKNSKSPIIDAPLTKATIVDDSFWTVEDANRLVINLQKLNQMEWWEAICEGDPKIDVKKVEPENSTLSDLDGETRQTVEKMMFDQRQKALGLPTSDEAQKFEVLEKFKKMHPEMDFSNAKIS